jgi:Holliday junction resolvase
MAMTPEKKVKQAVVKQLREYGAYHFYPVTGGYGASGVPDIVGCYKGTFFGIECKAGNNKPTALQEKNLHLIHAAGGIALVINEDNVGMVTAMLEALSEAEVKQ